MDNYGTSPDERPALPANCSRSGEEAQKLLMPVFPETGASPEATSMAANKDVTPCRSVWRQLLVPLVLPQEKMLPRGSFNCRQSPLIVMRLPHRHAGRERQNRFRIDSAPAFWSFRRRKTQSHGPAATNKGLRCFALFRQTADLR